MRKHTVVSNDRHCFIELTNRPSDPGSWIVRRWKKFLWFKTRISSDWFLDEKQAMTFAMKMKREYEAARLSELIKEKFSMQTIHYQPKHRRGSSPHQETEQWKSDLGGRPGSIARVPEGTFTPRQVMTKTEPGNYDARVPLSDGSVIIQKRMDS